MGLLDEITSAAKGALSQTDEGGVQGLLGNVLQNSSLGGLSGLMGNSAKADWDTWCRPGAAARASRSAWTS